MMYDKISHAGVNKEKRRTVSQHRISSAKVQIGKGKGHTESLLTGNKILQ
jgi:hypothetical protein